MTTHKIFSAVLTTFVVVLLSLPTYSSIAADYKVGDDCQGVDWDAYPKGMWCLEDLDGSITFQNIPVELDLATIENIEGKIERINCGKIKTRAECEILGIEETKKILATDFGLTDAQSEDLLSCSKVRDFGEQPPDTTYAGEYIEGPWESGAPRVCLWHHWPEKTAIERFSGLDGGAKFSIIFFVLLEIVFFGIFYSTFRENKSEKNGRSTAAALFKTLLSVVGVNLLIVFFVWLYIALIEPAMSGNKVDFSKKFLGVPQYMWTVIYTMYYIAWNSNRKK
jgi:hypothetical protein